MASTNPISSRLDELRSRNPQSPPSDNVHSGYTTPTRYSGSFLNSYSLSLSNDNRALQRRFTADSNNTPPVLPPIGFQPAPTMDSLDVGSNTMFKVHALERKRQELEKTREHRRRLDAQLEALDRQQGLEEEEYHQQVNEMLSTDYPSMNLSPGHQSEPTTPPEYRDQIYAGLKSRRNRYSSTSLMSPPSVNNRVSCSGSQLTSPPSEPVAMQQNGSDEDKLPSKSVPGSRRGSTDRFSAYVSETSIARHQSALRSNRYSMPVTSSMQPKRESVAGVPSTMGLSTVNTTSFLFDDEEKPGKRESATSPDVNSYLQMNTTDDKFPILVRGKPGVLSASSAALDLALGASGDDSQGDDWPNFNHNRHSQQSLPSMAFETPGSTQNGLGSPTGSQQLGSVGDSPALARTINRHSMEASIASSLPRSTHLTSAAATNGSVSARPSMANFQSSFSANDIPTLKSTPGASVMAVQPTHAEKHFHNHNASMGRVPPNGVSNRVSRDLTSNPVTSAATMGAVSASSRDETANAFKQLQTDLQAQMSPFGPTSSAGSPAEPVSGAITPPNMQPFANPAFYGGYGMQMMSMGMNGLSLGGPTPFANQMSLFPGQNPYGGLSPYNQMSGRFQESQARAMQQRRTQSNEDGARFNNAKIENYKGEILSICKDQHGCRYLQKQLETRNADAVGLIFTETHQHLNELMIDPFGNYLCQKLLEHCNDDQRTVLVNSAAPNMVKIALNQHGTRALQKMIEYLSTPEQIQTIIAALRDHVIDLIQDLNGNHVIQKCLNRLTANDFQFIFDAVGTHCVVVGTHRHGCCVLQRCIDHSTGQQRADLVSQITLSAFKLVQDPYGNYVLQYIIDLNEPTFTDPLCFTFLSSVPALSKHKFSSNVIEKCIRHAKPEMGNKMMEEMLNAEEMEKMLRDSYANYVVQTALDSAEPEMRGRLVDAIRPIMPSIRHTPHGRRIQSKINQDGNGTGGPLAMAGPNPQARHMSNGHGNFAGTSHRQAMYLGQGGPNIFGANGMPNGMMSGMVNGMPNGMPNGIANGMTNGMGGTPPFTPPRGRKMSNPNNGAFNAFNQLSPNGPFVSPQAFGRGNQAGNQTGGFGGFF